MSKDNELLNIKETNDIFCDVCNIIDVAQKVAHIAVNTTLIQRNWLLGKRIAEEELKGKNRAEYGKEIIKELSRKLNNHYGNGFAERSLYYFEKFYKLFPDILHSLSAESYPLLTWTHYRILLQVEDTQVRNWYENEAHKENWSFRTLQRNVSS